MSLDVGTIAPNFILPIDGGGELELASLKGRKVVLYSTPRIRRPDAHWKPKNSETISRILRMPAQTLLEFPKTALNAMTTSTPNTTFHFHSWRTPRVRLAKLSVYGLRR